MDSATVTVTGTQPPAPPDASAPCAEDTSETVMYLVDVLVPDKVVVLSVSTSPSAAVVGPLDSPAAAGSVA